MMKVFGHKIIYAVVILLVAMVVPFVAKGQSDGDIQSAEYFFRNKEYDKAAELYERLLDKSQNKFYYQQLLTSYIELGRYREAQKLVEQQAGEIGLGRTRHSPLGGWVSDGGRGWACRWVGGGADGALQ